MPRGWPAVISEQHHTRPAADIQSMCNEERKFEATPPKAQGARQNVHHFMTKLLVADFSGRHRGLSTIWQRGAMSVLSTLSLFKWQEISVKCARYW